MIGENDDPVVTNVILASGVVAITCESGLELKLFLSEPELVHPIVEVTKIIMANNPANLILEILLGNRMTDLLILFTLRLFFSENSNLYLPIKYVNKQLILSYIDMTASMLETILNFLKLLKN